MAAPRPHQQNPTRKQSAPIDFLMMYVTHGAFRRDLDRLLKAADTGTAHTPEVLAGWANFKHQLHLHHTVEDSHLWPRLRTEVADRPHALALLDAMEAEHARIDPLLDAVDAALADRSPAIGAKVRALRDDLVQHLDHEEQSALPLIQEVLEPADWKMFAGGMRAAQGLKGAAVYVPWILDDVSEGERDRFLGSMPAPVKVLNGLAWERSYRRRNLWGAR
ncbi:hemerythrin domain-containing protein [Streptomyces sp. NPDC102406]|uniref:hemerythrin domain-containing protein n=1 Tax=Streptomyces sp. NPDC102406 TaxID=3366171 RepID=UPI00380E3910